MQKKRYYLDTSVWVGINQDRVKFDTQLFFKMMLDSQSVCLYSEIVEYEMADKSKVARNFFKFWPGAREKVKKTSDVLKLADTYISLNVVDKKHRSDCIHIAAATIQGADVLVSWNFKHIVHVDKAKEYNFINMGLGYPMLEIRSPIQEVEYGFN